MLTVALLSTSCSADEEAIGYHGLISIGDVPKSMTDFVGSDCAAGRLDDCTAVDAQGREYVFFDGALSRISINKDSAQRGARLPADMLFGENIEKSNDKVSRFYGVSLDRGEVDGGVIYSSGFIIRSSSGVMYSIELISDRNGKLKEVIERTDF